MSGSDGGSLISQKGIIITIEASNKESGESFVHRFVFLLKGKHMKMDRKTKAARNPAKSKTNNSKSNGNDIGKKLNRSVARTKTAKGQFPSFEEEARQMQEESIEAGSDC